MLLAERARLCDALQEELDVLSADLRALRRERELAFFGAEDLTPSDFYTRADADRARTSARWVVHADRRHVPT